MPRRKRVASTAAAIWILAFGLVMAEPTSDGGEAIGTWWFENPAEEEWWYARLQMDGYKGEIEIMDWRGRTISVHRVKRTLVAPAGYAEQYMEQGRRYAWLLDKVNRLWRVDMRTWAMVQGTRAEDPREASTSSKATASGGWSTPAIIGALGAGGLAIASGGGGGGGEGTEKPAPTPEPAPSPEPAPQPTPDPPDQPPPETGSPGNPVPKPIGTAPEPETGDDPPAPAPTPGRPDAPPREGGSAEGLSDTEIQGRLRSQATFEAVNPGPAWRRGTGKGETIMVIDDGIDAGHPQFLSRADASQNRINPFTDVTYISTAAAFYRCYFDPGCEVRVEPTSDDAEIDALVDVLVNGAPVADDSVVYCIGTNEECSNHEGLYQEVAAVREKGPDGRAIRFHGTAVASVALGKDLGIAPDAELYFLSRPFASNEELNPESTLYTPEGAAVYAYLNFRSPPLLARYDELAASWYKWLTVGSGVTVINRSYGTRIRTWGELERREAAGIALYAWIEENLPKYMEAVRDPDAALIVTAAGNTPTPAPDFEGSLAYYDPALRGRYLAVVGIDKTGVIDDDSSRCGGLPDNWDPSSHGRHYCLAAPYYATVAFPRVVNGVDSNLEVDGTSFSAPVVSGAIALMAEQFRGQLSKKEIGRRLVDTANNRDESGTGGVDYSDHTIYGAGLVDIGAATSPVGTVETGITRKARAPMAGSRLVVPSAWGDMGGRAGEAEIAGFDEWNAPFFYQLGDLLETGGQEGTQWLRAQSEGNPGGPEWRGLQWTEPTGESNRVAWAYGGRYEGRTLTTYGWAYEWPETMGLQPSAGVVFEHDGMLGGRGYAAFEGNARHEMVFASARKDMELGWDGALRAHLRSTWAAGRLAGGAVSSRTPAACTPSTRRRCHGKKARRGAGRRSASGSRFARNRGTQSSSAPWGGHKRATGCTKRYGSRRRQAPAPSQ